MPKLSDTQCIVLSAAAQRDDRDLLPLPGSLRGGAAAKVVDALVAKGLVAESELDNPTAADAALDRIWRNDADGRAVSLHITAAGLEAIGIEPEESLDDGDPAPEGAAAAPNTDAAAEDTVTVAAAPMARTPRTGTKQARMIAMLRAPDGATIEEVVAATGWQPHTVRGAFAGALKKKLGLVVTSEKVDGRGRVYHLAG